MRTLLILAVLSVGCTQESPVQPDKTPVLPKAEEVKVEAPKEITAEPEVTDCVPVLKTDTKEPIPELTGTYTTGGPDDHQRHHFVIPENKNVLVLSANWPDEKWKIQIDAGVGTCPHSGTSHGNVTGTGTAKLFVKAQDLGLETFTPDEKWFAHLAIANEVGQGVSVNYTVKVEACTIK